MKGVIFILQMNQNDERYCYGGPGLHIDEGLLCLFTYKTITRQFQGYRFFFFLNCF